MRRFFALAPEGAIRPVVKDAVFTFAAFLYSLPAWAYPFGNDQALHWYIGRRWLDGVLPFVSAISSKPIGIFAVHAFSTGIMGDRQWAIRVTESLTVLLVGWLAALAARPVGAKAQDGEFGLGALVFSGIYYTFFDYWDTAHPEIFESTATLASFVVALRAQSPWQRDAGAGALATLGFMFKFPAGLPALGVAALCAVRAAQQRKEAEGVLAELASGALAVLAAAGRFLCGVLPVVALAVLPFALGGKLATMWEILGVYIFHYAEQASAAHGIFSWLRIEHGGGLMLLATGLTLSAALVAWERRDRELTFRLAWVVLGSLLAFGSVIMQKRYFTYHFVAIGSFMAALCVLGIRALPRERSEPSWQAFTFVVLALAFAFYLQPISGKEQSYRGHVKSWLAYKRGQTTRDVWLGGLEPHRSLDSPLYVQHLADKLNQLKQPKDRLCTRGFLTPLYPLTGMTCPSRHIVEENVNTGLPDWKREYRTALEKEPPTFMVTFGDRARDLKYLRERGYKVVYQEHLFRIMSRREPPPAPAGSPKGR